MMMSEDSTVPPASAINSSQAGPDVTAVVESFRRSSFDPTRSTKVLISLCLVSISFLMLYKENEVIWWTGEPGGDRGTPDPPPSHRTCRA